MILSIIVPFYRGNRFLPILLESIESNVKHLKKDENVEVIIINDSPNERVLVKSELYNFTITIYNNQKNEGIQQSRINGLNISKGDYIVFLDQDDNISEYWIRSQIDSIGDADLCISNGFLEDENLNKRLIYSSIKELESCLSLNCYILYKNPVVSPGQALIRKRSIPKEWTDNKFVNNGADDAFLWILMLLNRAKFAINNCNIYVHKYTGENTSLDLNQMMKSNLELCESLTGKIEKWKKLIMIRRVYYYGNYKNKLIYKLRYLDVALCRIFSKLFFT